jgi:hypothetical protein
MADAEGPAPWDLAAELSPGSPAAGPAGLLGELGAGLEGGLTGVAAGAEVAAAATPALDPAGASGASGVDGADAKLPVEAEVAATCERGGEDAAVLLVAVHPAVTRTGTSTSAAAIRRMPPSSPILRPQGPV